MASASAETVLFFASTIGRSALSNNASSSGVGVAMSPTRSIVSETMTASGLAGRRLRARRRATTASARASHSRW